MSLLKVNEVQNYNGSSLTLTASTVSTSAQLNTGGNISVTGSINVSDDSTTRSNLGLGSIATQDSDNVTVTGGTATLGALTVSGSDSGDLVRITQTGSGNALVVEDSTNPDSTPFVVNSSGNVGIGTSSPSAPLSFVNGQGAGTEIIKFNLGSESRGHSFDNVLATGRDLRLSTARTFYIEVGGDTATFPTEGDFVVSHGTNGESMRIDANGNVGIGTSQPNAPLHILANSSATSPSILLTDSSVGSDRVGFITNNSGDITLIAYNTTSVESRSEIILRDDRQIRFQTATNERMRIDSSGNIGAPSGTNIYNASDERLKQNITDLSGCLQKVISMRGVSFNWIDEFCDSEADKTLYGLIAQELQIVDSNLVDSFSDSTITAGSVTVENPLRVNEKFIIPMLVESIKEQQALIESQQSQIDALTARIEALEATP